MQCPACGLTVMDGGNFCSRCGTSLTAQDRSSQAPAAGPADVSVPAPRGRDAAPAPAEEKTVWCEHPSMRTAIPVLCMVLAAYAAVAIAIWALLPGKQGTGISHTNLQLIVLGGFAVVYFLVLLRYFIRTRSTRYRLSSQRLFVEHGLLSKRIDEVELEHYKDIFVSQDFLDRLVGCGDVQVVTGDVTNPTVDIIDVLDPVAKKEIIRTAARERKASLGILRREDL